MEVDSLHVASHSETQPVQKRVKQSLFDQHPIFRYSTHVVSKDIKTQYLYNRNDNFTKHVMFMAQ